MTDGSSEPAITRRTTTWVVVGTGVAGVVIALIAAFTLLGGDEEVETKGDCHDATYELGAERDDDNRMTANLEIKAAEAGQEWTVKVVGNDKTIVDDTRRSDDEAEIDVDAFLGTGEDQVDVRAFFTKTGTDQTCDARVKLG